MKIIISPSKTQNVQYFSQYKSSQPVFYDTAQQINKIFKAFSINELKSIYKASDEIINETYSNIQNFDNANAGQAIFSYTGAVFNEIKPLDMTDSQIEYLNANLIILSAQYGILRPYDMIKAYRLDYFTKIPDIDLKIIWKDKINEYIKDDKIIINLASKEFSSLIDKDMIDIEFKEKRNGKYVVVGTYAKKARGKMVNLLAENNISDINEIKKLAINDYKYNIELSDNSKFVFIK